MMNYPYSDPHMGHYSYPNKSPVFSRNIRYNQYSAQDKITDVWQSNVEEEMDKISKLLEDYPYVAMDTEFPGTVFKFEKGPSTFTTAGSFIHMRYNVNSLKMIQVGLSLFNEAGQQPPGVTTWQFNLRFNYQEELHNMDSIDLLIRSGIQFHRLITEGIPHQYFSVLLLTSGLISNPRIRWITFHSSQDFGYILRMLTNNDIPNDVQEFYQQLFYFFPNFFDVRMLVNDIRTLRGGLQEISENVYLMRVGIQHQAGSDALLTGQLFFKLRENSSLPPHKRIFEGAIDEESYRCHLFLLDPPEKVPPKSFKQLF